MLILFDNGTPRTLARYLVGEHTVTEARARGWAELENGDLPRETEEAGFELMITTDKNIGYQQNLTGRRIAILVLGKGRWSLTSPHVARVLAAVIDARPGSYCEVEIPYS